MLSANNIKYMKLDFVYYIRNEVYLFLLFLVFKHEVNILMDVQVEKTRK